MLQNSSIEKLGNPLCNLGFHKFSIFYTEYPAPTGMFLTQKVVEFL